MQLIHGDCFLELKKIPSHSVDFICIDPPYADFNHLKWDKKLNFDVLFDEFFRILKNNHFLCVFGEEPFSTKVRLAGKEKYRYDWYHLKRHATGFLNAHYQPLRRVENIMVFTEAALSTGAKTKDIPYYPQLGQTTRVRTNKSFEKTARKKSLYNKKMGFYYDGCERCVGTPLNIIDIFDGEMSGEHFTYKSVNLLKYLIRTYTKPKDVVLDCFMGSGSCGVAAVETNRDFIGMELEKEQFDIAKENIEARVKNESNALFPSSEIEA